MRQAKREIKEYREIIEVVKKCQVVRLAVNDGEYPYIVPLNFGYIVNGDLNNENSSLESCPLTLYFHSALEGKKIDLLRKNNKAFFEMDCEHQVVTYKTDNPMGGHCSFMYESVMGKGTVEFVEDEDEKIKYLTILTDRYHLEHFKFNQAAVPVTSVYKLTVNEITGKKRPDPR